MMQRARVVVLWAIVIFFAAIIVCLIASSSSAEGGDQTSISNFTVNATSPYYTMFGDQLVEEGDNLTLTVQAPSILDDPQMAGVEFQVCTSASRYSFNNGVGTTVCRTWETIGYDNDTSDMNYTVIWKAEEISWNKPYAFKVLTHGAGNSSEQFETNVTGTNSICDLSIKEFSLLDNNINSGENITVNIIVHCESIYNCTKYIFNIDIYEEGVYGMTHIDRKSIQNDDLSVDIYPDDPNLGPGDHFISFVWAPPSPRGYGEKISSNISINVRTSVYSNELNFSNNRASLPYEIFNAPMSPYGMSLSTFNSREWNDSYQQYLCKLGGYIVYDRVEYMVYGPMATSFDDPIAYTYSINWTQAQFMELFYLNNTYPSNWLIPLNTTAMPEGQYFLDVLAYNGSRIILRDNEFIHVIRSEDDEADGDAADSPTPWLVPASLVILIALLFGGVVRTPHDSRKMK